MKYLVLGAATALFCAAPPASAGGYVASYSVWQSLDVDTKSSYAMGALDAMFIAQVGDKNAEAFADGLSDCIRAQNLSSTHLRELIDIGYRDPEAWSRPASLVLIQQLHKTCRSDIDRRRLEHGLAPASR